MAERQLTMKFYSQPEEGDHIGFKIADDAATYGLYEFTQVGNLTNVDFTYRAPSTKTVNGAIGFNNDLTPLSAFNSAAILGGNIAGVMRNDDTTGTIYDADSDGDSTIIVGQFDLYDGYSSVNIARINSRNGMLLNSYATTVASIIYAVRYAPGDGGSYYIGGSQTLWNGTSIKQFAKVLGSGLLDTAFNANVAATGLFNSTTTVTKITIEPGTNRILVGYTNSTGGGRVARFETDGTLDATWTNPACTNSTGSGLVYIRAITIDTSTYDVYIGGNFEQCNGNASRLMAKVDTTGTYEDFVAFTGGSTCRAISIDSAINPFVLIATDANAVMSYSDPLSITYGMSGLGITAVNKTTGIVNDYFMDRIATGISSENYIVGGIYDIQVISNPGEPYGRGNNFIVLGGSFKKFGPYRAENIISFTFFNEFDAPFVINQNTPFYSQNFDTLKFSGDNSIIYRVICSKLRPGGAEGQYTNHCLAFGRFEYIRGMHTTTNYYLDDTVIPSEDKWNINRNIEIGETKINKNSVSFTIDTEITPVEGNILLAIGNLYNPDANILYYDGLSIPFTFAGDPGTVKIDLNIIQNLADFLEDWMETTVYPNLIAATRELGEDGKPGIRDFYYNITTTANSVTLELNNPLWENWLLTSIDFPEPYIGTSITEAIEWRSALAHTYWNTYKKFNLEWQAVQFYYVNLKYGYYSYDAAFYGSTIKLSLDDGGPFVPPIVPRIISFIDIVQLLGEIEIFDLEQMIADAQLALTRSPIMLKSIGTQSSTVFDVQAYIGNIEDPAPSYYSLTKQKLVSSQTALYIDLANIVREDLEADITGFLSDTPVMELGVNESRWVRVRMQNYNGFATASNPTALYHVMDGYVTPYELNGTPESINTFPRILTPHTNLIARGSAPRLYYRNKDVAVIYSLTLEGYDPYGEPEYWFNSIEPNVFVSENNLYYNSIDVATYLGTSDQVIFGIVYMDELEEIITYNVYDECRYENYELIFKNKWGVLESISMSKKTTKQLNVSGDEYLRSIVDINGDYDINRHTRRQFNVNGYEEWTLNTPFIPEYMNESIKQAMLSEELWIRESGYFQFGELVRTDFAYPAIRLDQSLVYKTNLDDQNIQYTIKVRLSHNEIKNIR